MNSFVFTRHTSDCKYKHDRQYRRCNCPKWVEARVNGERIRKSVSSRIWDEAELFRQRLEDSVAQGRPPIASRTAPIVSSTLTSTSPEPVLATAAQVVLPRKQSAVGYGTSPVPAAPGFAVVTTFSASEIPVPGRRPRVTVKKAVGAYMTDARSRGLQPDTLKKLERLFEKQFLPWCTEEDFEYLDQVDLDALLDFRSTWTEGALVKIKKQERIIGFFGDSFRRNYIGHNPALSMSKIRHKQVPTDYFPPTEFERIIQATYLYGDPRGGYIPIDDTRIRLRTLTLLMRWSGLRIGDAVTLERSRLQGDNLMLYQAKTGTPVFVPLPIFLVEELGKLPSGPRPNPRYFFWSGNGLPKSAVADWQRSYRRLFSLADIRKPDGQRKRCYPHMFRDTFAVELLLAGVPMDQVSLLLGHTSVRITERSYAPFVKARQLQLQESVRNAWKANQCSCENQNDDSSEPLGSVRQTRYRGWQLIPKKSL